MDENYFSENLRYLRQLKGFTLVECGDIFDLGKSQISLYENGKSYPPIPIARKICNYFNLSLSELFEMDLRPSAPPNGSPPRPLHRAGANGSSNSPPEPSRQVALVLDVGGVSTATESPPLSSEGSPLDKGVLSDSTAATESPPQEEKVKKMERKLLEMMLELQDLKG